jgi:hypothetical protein
MCYFENISIYTVYISVSYFTFTISLYLKENLDFLENKVYNGPLNNHQ